jgi:hypothetical protein
MKTDIFVAAFCATLALSYSSAFAQDTNRVPEIIREVDAVDASVHSDVVERALQEPQPSQEPVKLPMIYSRWVLNSSGRPPATLYWPDPAKDTTSTAAPGDSDSPSPLRSPPFQAGRQMLAPTVWSARPRDPTANLVNEVNFVKHEWNPGLFNSLAISRTQNSSTDPQHLKTIVPPLSPQTEVDGFSTSFRAVQFAVADDPPWLYPSPKKTFSSKWSTRKQHKRLEGEKHADTGHSSAIKRFSSEHQKLAGSHLPPKAD